MSAAMRTCAIVPTHDHWRAIGTVIGALRAAALPVFVIDDGSVEPAATAIAALHCMDENVEVHRLAVNQGKGAAVMHGMRLACKAGYTHAVQIDADGQHDMAALLTLLERSRQRPSALISAEPMFDASMPTGRRIGRRITHFWVWIETMSLRVTDSMCGFRVYPLLAVQALLAEQSVGKRMEFDTEIMVRLFQRGTAVEMVPVRVSYPPGNTSNFRPLADNLRIGAMHARLVLSMLFRQACARHLARHWAALSERGAWWGLRISAAACRLLGQRGCLLMLAPVVGYFVATAAAQRRASRDFLQRATGNPTTVWDVYRHFSSFAARLVESFRAWDGAIPAGAVVTDTSDALACLSADASGALLVVAHLGNADLARALLDDASRSRLAILVHTHHAMNYNRLLRDFRPAAALNLIQVTEIGPATIIDLQQRVDRGEWVVIAGDRTPVTGENHVSFVPFLRREAAFSHGPWILGSLLQCPVHLLFCVRTGDGWRLSLEPFADRIRLDRKNRRDALRGHAAAYAARLETYARAFPLQWYNFFDFWAR